MNRVRVSFLSLACASLLTLAACGGEDATPTAGTAPSAVATSTAPAPAPSTADAVDDKQLCEAAKQASDKMKEDLIAAVSSGTEPSPELFKKVLSELQNEVTQTAATGASDSEVVAALEQFGAEAGKAANAADPGTAADNPDFDKAGNSLGTACEAAGGTF
ncbi:hypothetical protein HCA58_03000 [Micromonospora sp. HNM0581]|uniref:hypothetical protein n=1 Tax=Micromonospora sp. HNM0581 TaxID=2716341 RepID=UPI001469C3BB|nr:hypothetical protein [Micromonospora sp. HNM0581]NLU77374.1 hypothetical protein [Micromonospora sp. HNM0581]